MKLVTYLGFDGKCREAFGFYHDVLGGEVVAMISHEDMGIPTEDPGHASKIMHARLDIGDQCLMGGDFPPGVTATPQGMSVSIHLDTDDEAQRVYDRLAEGGQVMMPLSETEWASKFAMLTDRYGTPWIVNLEKTPQ